jgi:hypothetical protein
MALPPPAVVDDGDLVGTAVAGGSAGVDAHPVSEAIIVAVHSRPRHLARRDAARLARDANID